MAEESLTERNNAVVVCAVCQATFRDMSGLAEHFLETAARSDSDHIMWLNRKVSKDRKSAAELEKLLCSQASGILRRDEKVKR